MSAQMLQIDEMDDMELRETEDAYHEQIYGEYACYGMSELHTHQRLLEEMVARDVEPVRGELKSADE